MMQMHGTRRLDGSETPFEAGDAFKSSAGIEVEPVFLFRFGMPDDFKKKQIHGTQMEKRF